MYPALTQAHGKIRPPRPSVVAAYLRQLPASVTWWTAMVLLEAGQVFFLDARRGDVLPLSHYLIWASLEWYPWALLTPWILALVRRYPITRQNWVRLIVFPHSLACLACICMQMVLRGLTGSLYSLYESPASPLALINESLEKRDLQNITAYCLVVAAGAYLQLRAEFQLRQLRQAQLEARLASAQLEVLRMQLQPHFLFNTLQAAITLVQEDPRAAEDVLLRLSQLLRITFDEMGTNEVPLSRELQFLDLYLGIQKLRFGDRLAVDIRAEASALNYAVPTLLLQPLVENAIRHGLGKHKGEDLIEVIARVARGGLELEVRNKNSVVDDTMDGLLRRGVGLRNIKARLEQLHGPASFLTVCAQERRGAVVTIFVPSLRGGGMYETNSRGDMAFAVGSRG